MVRLGNVIYWLPVIVGDQPYDWSYLVRILRHKLAQMERAFVQEGITTDSPQQAAELHMAVLLCDRLLDEERYWANSEASARLMGWPRKRVFAHAMWMKEQDARALGAFIGKKLLSWWW